jgi:hypothetical protein
MAADRGISFETSQERGDLIIDFPLTFLSIDPTVHTWRFRRRHFPAHASLGVKDCQSGALSIIFSRLDVRWRPPEDRVTMNVPTWNSSSVLAILMSVANARSRVLIDTGFPVCGLRMTPYLLFVQGWRDPAPRNV